MECGDCTACCTLLVVPELDKAAGTACSHCTTKCEIYESRPQACRDLSCAYHQVKNANIRMRPDKCGVVFEKLEDDLMFGTVNPKHEDFSFMHGQINAFLKEGINVVLSNNGRSATYHLDNVDPISLLSRVHKISEAQNRNSNV
jgi:hypothetical protein